VEQAGRLEEFRRYVLAEAEAPPPPIPGGRLLRMLPSWLPDLARSWGTRAMRPLARRRWAAAGGRSALRLHLGCGWNRLDGWVNVDLAATRAEIPWDLRQGVPLPDGSVEAIYHEHMLEHLSLRDGYLFTCECARLLRPGGVLRVAVPDAGACIDSYSGKGSPDWARSRPTGMLAVEALFYENGHRAMYDAETLITMCLAAGFEEAVAQEYGRSWIADCPDSAERASGTLYVDARRA
jgi:predicted SAM-dependent methyltransferase